MVAQKTLALALVVCCVFSCNPFASKVPETAIGHKPGWVSRLLASRDIDASIDKLISEIAMGAKEPWIKVALGRLYAEQELFGLSHQQYEALLNDYPNLPQAKTDLASICMYRGEYELGLQQLSALGDSHSHLAFDRALLYLNLEREAMALRHVERCLTLDPQDVEAQELKVVLKFALKDNNGAEKALLRLQKLKPTSTFALRNLIWIKNAQGKLSDRDTLIAQLRKLDVDVPNTPAILLQSMRDTFPWPPENEFKFRDWSGKPWSPKR